MTRLTYRQEHGFGPKLVPPYRGDFSTRQTFLHAANYFGAAFALQHWKQPIEQVAKDFCAMRDRINRGELR